MFTLDKEAINSVVVSKDPETGEVKVTLDLQADRLDDKTLGFLNSLSDMPVLDVLNSLGSDSTKNIKSKLDEEIRSELSEKSSRLGKLKSDQEKPV